MHVPWDTFSDVHPGQYNEGVRMKQFGDNEEVVVLNLSANLFSMPSDCEKSRLLWGRASKTNSAVVMAGRKVLQGSSAQEERLCAGDDGSR